MEFRLIYRGPLKAAGSSTGRAMDKQAIRKQLHKQLRELWDQQPNLRFQAQNKFAVTTFGPVPERRIIPVSKEVQGPNVKTWFEHIANNYQRCGGRFVPLVSKAGGFTCSLDILFLRRDNPGNLIASGGDIDNRIKVLFDGLKLPETIADLGGMSVETDEDPFCCLLEDDSLITSVSVTTDRLLAPLEGAENIHDVCLIIHVTVLDPSALFTGGRLV